MNVFFKKLVSSTRKELTEALTAKVTYYESTSYSGKLPRKLRTYAVNVELQALYSYFVGTFNKHVWL